MVYSASADEVIREMTAADMSWLEGRRENARHRHTGAFEEAEFIIRELSG